MAEDANSSGLTQKPSPRDRELGAIAQYELRASLDLAEAARKYGHSEPAALLQWVSQVVVLLTDKDAAARWFATKSQSYKAFEGREVGGFLYRKVDFYPLSDLGNEAAVVVSHNEIEETQFVDTYVNVRIGRLFGGVGASTYKELEVRGDLVELARRLVARMEALSVEGEQANAS
jgi:hypothetical protein